MVPDKYDDTLFFTRKTWYTSCDYSYAGNSCEGFVTGGCWRGVVVCWGSKQGLPKCHNRPPLSLLLIVFCFLKILRQPKRTFFSMPHTQKNWRNNLVNPVHTLDKILKNIMYFNAWLILPKLIKMYTYSNRFSFFSIIFFLIKVASNLILSVYMGHCGELT